MILLGTLARDGVLDSGVRRNDGWRRSGGHDASKTARFALAARERAGETRMTDWIPAVAGMTEAAGWSSSLAGVLRGSKVA